MVARRRRGRLVVGGGGLLVLVVAALDRRIRELAAGGLCGRREIAGLLRGQLDVGRRGGRRAVGGAAAAADRAGDQQHGGRDDRDAGEHAAGELQTLPAGG